MKKFKSGSDELRTEYKRSDFGKLERGKYPKRDLAGSNVVVLDDEISAVFPNAAAVNKALQSLVDVAQKLQVKHVPSDAQSLRAGELCVRSTGLASQGDKHG